MGKSRRDDTERQRAAWRGRERQGRAVAGVRDRERGLARGRRPVRDRRAGVVAVGGGRDRRQSRRADRRRPLAALALARQQLDPLAGARGGAARDRDHHRRRARSGGDARRPRPARRARREGDLLLHRRRGACPPCPVPRDRRGAATACRTTAIATRIASRCSGRRRWRARSPPRRRRSPTSPARHRASSALPPGCAIRSWRRCCSASTCSSSAGHGAASIPCGASRRDVLARLARSLAGGDILTVHDGNAARAEDGTAVLLAVLPGLLAHARSLGLVAVTLPAASLQQRGDDAVAPAEAAASASP